MNDVRPRVSRPVVMRRHFLLTCAYDLVHSARARGLRAFRGLFRGLPPLRPGCNGSYCSLNNAYAMRVLGVRSLSFQATAGARLSFPRDSSSSRSSATMSTSKQRPSPAIGPRWLLTLSAWATPFASLRTRTAWMSRPSSIVTRSSPHSASLRGRVSSWDVDFSLWWTNLFFGMSTHADEVVDDRYDSKHSDENGHPNEHGRCPTRRMPGSKQATG
jgi:hypothetical protein